MRCWCVSLLSNWPSSRHPQTERDTSALDRDFCEFYNFEGRLHLCIKNIIYVLISWDVEDCSNIVGSDLSLSFLWSRYFLICISSGTGFIFLCLYTTFACKIMFTLGFLFHRILFLPFHSQIRQRTALLLPAFTVLLNFLWTCYSRFLHCRVICYPRLLLWCDEYDHLTTQVTTSSMCNNGKGLFGRTY